MAGLEMTKSEENEQVRKAARIYYEANPQVTIQMVAQRFGVSQSCVAHWSARNKWTKACKLPSRGVAADYLSLVKRSARKNGGQLDDNQIQMLSYLEYQKGRNRVASHLSRDLQILQNKIMSEAIRGDTGPAAIDRLKKLALSADALKKLSSELRLLWNLDDGTRPEIDDGIADLYVKQAEELLSKRLSNNSDPAEALPPKAV